MNINKKIEEEIERLKKDNWHRLKYETPGDVCFEEYDFSGNQVIENFHFYKISSYKKYLKNLLEKIESLDPKDGDYVISVNTNDGEIILYKDDILKKMRSDRDSAIEWKGGENISKKYF